MASARGQRLNSMWAGQQAMDNAARNQGLLTGQYNLAQDALTRGTANADAAYREGQGQALGSLGKYYDQSRADLNTGYANATGALDGAIGRFEPYATAGVGASGARADFLGLNGADGNGRAGAALSRFRDSTGYRDIADEALESAMRNANRTGMLASGNTYDALARLGGSLADRSAQGYLDNLGRVSAEGMQAAGQQVGVQGQLANYGFQNGAGLAGLAGGQGGREADIYQRGAALLGNLQSGLGGQQANLYTGLGNALVANNNNETGALTNAGNRAADASAAAKVGNQNLMMGLVGQGLGLLGLPMGGGGGSLGGSMFGSMFGGGAGLPQNIRPTGQLY